MSTLTEDELLKQLRQILAETAMDGRLHEQLQRLGQSMLSQNRDLTVMNKAFDQLTGKLTLIKLILETTEDPAVMARRLFDKGPK